MTKERSILFSSEMVRAILNGRKTQTRRVIKPQRPDWWPDYSAKISAGHSFGEMLLFNSDGTRAKLPYTRGDTLWVRETWATARMYDADKPSEIPEDASLWWLADKFSHRFLGAKQGKTRPSIFMPRWASRITLEIISVRVERVQAISEEDARAEGTESTQRSYGTAWRDYRGPRGAWFTDAKTSFDTLWDSINARRGYGWDVNPWVWCIEFTLAEVFAK